MSFQLSVESPGHLSSFLGFFMMVKSWLQAIFYFLCAETIKFQMFALCGQETLLTLVLLEKGWACFCFD